MNPNDIVYTPPHVAKIIVDTCINNYGASGTFLDPCRGTGVFYDLFPTTKDYCEINEGIDFFNYTKKCDWIISNPPYSIFRKWLQHSFNIADNIVYLIPIAKIVSSKSIMTDISNYGGIVEIDARWSGRDIGFPFGFPCGFVYFKRGWTEPAKLILRT